MNLRQDTLRDKHLINTFYQLPGPRLKLYAKFLIHNEAFRPIGDKVKLPKIFLKQNILKISLINMSFVMKILTYRFYICTLISKLLKSGIARVLLFCQTQTNS